MEQLFSNLSHAVEGGAVIALIAAAAWGVLSILSAPAILPAFRSSWDSSANKAG